MAETQTEEAHITAVDAARIRLTLTADYRATNFPANTATSTSTPRVTPTIAPIPTLGSHTWSPDEVLVAFGGTGGDGGGGIPFRFRLLANGSLYVFDYSSDADDYKMYEATLTESQSCQLLNTVEQTGFFSYDPSIYYYGNGPGAGGGSMIIDVDAWRSNYVSHYDFWGFASGRAYQYYEDCPYCDPPPIVMPSVLNTFNLLDAFWPEGIAPSGNRQVIVTIDEIDEPTDDEIASAREWPYAFLALGNEVDSANCSSGYTNVTFFGEESRQVAEEMQRSGGRFTESERLFWVDIFYDIPEMLYPACGGEGDFAVVIISDMPETLTCTPEDGVLPIPSP